VSELNAAEPLTLNEPTVAAAVAAALAAFAAADDAAALKAAKTAFTGETSVLARLNSTLRNVPNEQKAAAGKLVGQARSAIAQALAAREAHVLTLEEASRLAAEAIDVTALPSRRRVGARHPLSLLQEKIADIFVGMGWEVAEAPSSRASGSTSTR
jgi:phenylalanyl-tRNA synthetase alpha chain